MKHSFQTEINQLLDLMIHSLYSNKEIFLRELVSNASDALDKLNYLTLSDDNFKNIKFNPQINISFDEDKGLLSIEDNGLGMSKDDLIDNLGTIAKSGTKTFLNSLSGDKKKDSALIGQFGVGFYSSFMVASKVVVTSKKAGSNDAFAWVSDGKGEYEINECVKDNFGTKIDLYLKEDSKEFANKWRIESLIKKYSDHIAFPIILSYDSKEKNSDDKDAKEEIVHKEEQINKAKALWKISKNELKDEDYVEFYNSFSYDSSKPLRWIHTKVEGNLEYTTLFYIPSKAPYDIFRVDYQSGVKLYVKRVFITDNDKELLPQYLRFIKGIIDSEDLPLNVSREILQQNKILANIKSASTKKILSEIEKISKDEVQYKEFYNEFGKLIKEGLYSDYENKDKLLSLCRFNTTKRDFASLAEYKKDAKDSNLYYIIGSDLDLLKNSPLLEKYIKDNIEVLLLSDEVDSFVIPSIGEYDGLKFKNINEEINEDKINDEVIKEYQPLLDYIKGLLGDKVKDVKLSSRLDKSPVCVISKESNPMMEQLMKQMGQDFKENAPIFEINPDNKIIKEIKNLDESKKSDLIYLLFDSAKLLNKGTMSDATSFADRLNRFIESNI